MGHPVDSTDLKNHRDVLIGLKSHTQGGGKQNFWLDIQSSVGVPQKLTVQSRCRKGSDSSILNKVFLVS